MALSIKKRIKELYTNIDKLCNDNSVDIIYKNQNHTWDWIYLSRTINLIHVNKKYLQLPWCWDIISEGNYITIEFIKNNIDKKFNWYKISMNPIITLNDIETNLDLPWDWAYVSANINITAKFIDKYIDKDWDWYVLSESNYINDYIVDKYNYKNWNWVELSKNSKLTMKFFDKYINKPLDYYNLSYNSNLTIEFIEKYIDKNFNWKYLTCCDIITVEFMEKHINKTWDWHSSLCFNSNLTINNLIKYNLIYKYRNSSQCNMFNNECKTIKFIEFRKHMAAFKIQQWYHHIRTNQNYAFCRKRVNIFYDKTLSQFC